MSVNTYSYHSCTFPLGSDSEANRIIEGGWGAFDTMSVGGLSILSILQKPPIEEGKFVASFLGGGGKLATRREMQGQILRNS